MKKNNKGFTLIELLAALVILGVLSTLALPTVVNLLGNSRDKLYITDAKKLISQAEYKFRVASSEIEKPDDGECLLLSMVYLDNSDFDNPPNNGEYVREASYVVVKNNGGDYEFSVELVEEVKKNVFKGVELSKDANLSTSSTRHIVSFKKDDLYFVENNTVAGKYSGKQVDTNYINSKLGASYVSAITKVYNYPDLAESTYNANYAIPKIVRAEFHSASNKPFNSLDTILKVVATDVDTKTDKLEVFVGFNHYPDLGILDVSDPNDPYDFTDRKYEYGSLSDFSLPVNFASAGFDYSGQTTSLYIVVVDPEGNSDRINRSYTIHTNEAPIIDKSKSGIFKRSSDAINLSTAVLKLSVTDDSTPNADLEYCLTEDKNATSCVGYKSYSEFVNSEINYTFSCGENCSYDGRELYLKVFLRDKDPTRVLESSEVFTYNLFRNDTPQIVNVELVSEQLPFVTANALATKTDLALKADVKLTINDSSSESNLTVFLDENPNFENAKSYTYSEFAGNVTYTFSGLYDGQERTLHIKVVDEYGATDTHVEIYGKVHANARPVIESVEFFTEDLITNVCPSSKICDKYEDNGGSYKVTVKATASDDLVSENDLRICISDDKSVCENVSSPDFLLYSSGRERYLELKPDAGTRVYDGSSKKIYVVVYDGYGIAVDGTYDYSAVTDINEPPFEYQIYVNQPPEINVGEFTVVSKNIDYNFRDVEVSFKVNDDLDSIRNLRYKLQDNAGGTVVEGTVTANSADDATVVNYSFGGDYNGGERVLTLTVYDSYNKSSTAEQNYLIHENEAPNINYVTVESAEPPCGNDTCANGNGLKTNVRLSVKDDLDTNIDQLQLCLTTVENSCTTFTALGSYPGAVKEDNGEYVIPFTLNITDPLPFKGTTHTVYAYVKDSYGKEGSKSGSYTLYNNTKASIDSEYPVVQSSNYEEQEVELEGGEKFVTNKNPNISTFKFKLKASDEFVQNTDLKYQVCYTTDPTVSITGTEGVTCLENNKFYDYVPDSTGVSVNDLDLSITSYNGQQFYIFAKVYDNYAYACATGATTCPENENYIGYSSQAYYQVYEDIEPEITKFTIARPEGTSSFATLNGTFKVKDQLDTYQYCISENEETCTNYSSTSYSGDEADTERTFTYNPTWGDVDTPSEDRTFLLYLFIKDSHGKVTKASTFTERIPCSPTEDGEGNFVDSGNVQGSIEYTLNSGSQELTAEKCSYKCYYWDAYEVDGEQFSASENADIKAFYHKKVTYLDKDDNDIVCSIDDNPNYEVHCNFRTCYYNSNTGNYNVTAIGYIKYDNEDSSFTHTSGSDSHAPTYYRNEYTTSYDEENDIIELHPTGNKICGQCFDEGKYEKVIVTYDNN